MGLHAAGVVFAAAGRDVYVSAGKVGGGTGVRNCEADISLRTILALFEDVVDMLLVAIFRDPQGIGVKIGIVCRDLLGALV